MSEEQKEKPIEIHCENCGKLLGSLLPFNIIPEDPYIGAEILCAKCAEGKEGIYVNSSTLNKKPTIVSILSTKVYDTKIPTTS